MILVWENREYVLTFTQLASLEVLLSTYCQHQAERRRQVNQRRLADSSVMRHEAQARHLQVTRSVEFSRGKRERYGVGGEKESEREKAEERLLTFTRRVWGS